MIITDSLQPLGVKNAVAIGYFDGMHRGHMSVLRQALEQAAGYSLSSAILTFDMSRTRSPGKGSRDLTSAGFRQKKAEELGFDYYIDLDFASISDMTEKEFVSRILGRGCLNAAVVVCGENFRFGKGRSGDVKSLRRLCGPYGIRVVSVEPLLYGGDAISTSRIKKLIENGDVATAAKLLGYPYFIEGTVVEGNRLAHTLGFPTANMDLSPSLVCPRRGVYLSRTEVDGQQWKSITNIGVRPTVTEDVIPVCETHLVDFEGDLYGKELKTELFKFIRPEKQFSSVEELKETVLQNVDYARTVVLDDTSL